MTTDGRDGMESIATGDATDTAALVPRRHPVRLVGAGPGDPELLTVKAIRAIRWASVLLVDDLVGEGVVRLARRSARVVRVGKRGGCASTPQAFIERLMVAEAARGERVVRLKGGDPFVFGRGGEEAETLRAAGFDVEIVNGISAGFAAAAAAGVPLTHRDHASGVLFVTGHGRADGAAGPTVDWPALGALAAGGVTLVVYMAIRGVAAMAEGLARTLPGDTPAVVVQGASTAAERRIACRLDALPATVQAHRLGSPAIVLVGAVAGLASLDLREAVDGRSRPLLQVQRS